MGFEDPCKDHLFCRVSSDSGPFRVFCVNHIRAIQFQRNDCAEYKFRHILEHAINLLCDHILLSIVLTFSSGIYHLHFLALILIQIIFKCVAAILNRAIAYSDSLVSVGARNILSGRRN
ncbi:hypothetical protein LTS17_007429 [Exophiala oligosperma]